MGKIKYLTKIQELFEKSPVVTFGSIKRIAGSEGYSKLLINNLIKRGKIHKIAKGYYTKHSEITLAVFCFKPAYLGLQHALSFHNLWEQETIPVILTTRKIRRGIRKIMGSNIYIRNLKREYFFGYDYMKESDFYFPYSDIEKTFIDMNHFKLYMDKELIDNFKERIDKKKLVKYLKKYPLRFRKRVLKKLRKE